MTIGDRIKKEREKKGITQVDLAIKINVSKQTLYKYEHNIITNIPSDKIEAISATLNCSPAYLMGWEKNLTKSNADLITDILYDTKLIEHIQKLNSLSNEHQKTIFDNIDYWYEKEGH